MLRLVGTAYAQIIGHAYDGLPDEACGLLIGDSELAWASTFVATDNAAASSRIYEIPPKAFLQADRTADDRGETILGVVHSHTHTDAYPSPTDVAQAPDPSWHYVIVSLADTAPVLRSYRIVDGEIAEEPVRIEAG